MIEPSWIIEEKREICEAVTSLNEVILIVTSTYIPLDQGANLWQGPELKGCWNC